jgi:hypothetical protein
MDYITTWYLYFVFELLARGGCLYKIEEPRNAVPALFPSKEKALIDVLIFLISPGYTLANHYKNIIRSNNLGNVKLRKIKLSKYIASNNKLNLLLSSILLNITLWFPFDENSPHIESMFSLFVMARFLSRSFEITYAFGKDAMSKSSSSTLNKYDRLALALKSYFEIYIISASVYYFFLKICHTELASVLASLNIGTFVGADQYTRFNQADDITILLPFIQIISTSTLVIFSLAMYAGRDK